MAISRRVQRAGAKAIYCAPMPVNTSSSGLGRINANSSVERLTFFKTTKHQSVLPELLPDFDLDLFSLSQHPYLPRELAAEFNEANEILT